MTSKQVKYGQATAKNFSNEELKKVKENWEYAKMRFPKEHAESEKLIQIKGLQGHREVHEHYLKYKVPIDARQLSIISVYADTTYAGAFNRGVQLEDKPTTSGNTEKDDLFRQAIKPEGAE